MPKQAWQETLVNQIAAGTLFNTYTTSKSVINAQSLYSLYPGFWTIGRMVRIAVVGAISNIVTTPGTVTFEVKLGPTANIVAFTTGAMQMSTTAHTTLPFWLDILLTCRAVGASTSANLIGQGIMSSQTVAATAVADSTSSHTSLMCPNTAPAVGTGFDSTVTNLLDLWVGFSISNAGNGVQIQQYKVTDLGT